METPKDKPRFAAMRMVPRVSAPEIQARVQARLTAGVVVKTDGCQGYSLLERPPRRYEWVVPGSGLEAVKMLPRVHTLIANVKGNIRGFITG